MSAIVPAYGPLDAPLLVVGERPGKNEVLEGRPFVGETGRFVRNALRHAGLNPETQVRWTNAVPVYDYEAVDAALLRKHWDNVTSELTPGRVVLALGALACNRVTGKHDVQSYHGSVMETNDRVWAVVSLHPAGVMRTKLQAERVAIERVIARAARYALGRLVAQGTANRYADYRPISDPFHVDALLSGTRTVAFDTEFEPGCPPWGMQFSVDGRRAWLIDLHDGWWTVSGLSGKQIELLDVLRKHMRRDDLTKIAHMHNAEVASLSRLGIETRAPWFDTLVGFSTVYPDLPVGLGRVGTFYLDDLANWKDRETTDPVYRAHDVNVLWWVYQNVRRDLGMAMAYEPYERAMRAMPRLWHMERFGMHVDEPTAVSIRSELDVEMDRLFTLVQEGVAARLFGRRADEAKRQLEQVEAALRALPNSKLRCVVHPTYDGLRIKRWAKDVRCRCRATYDSLANVRIERIKLRAQRMAWSNRVERWRQFDPGNNEHLRWLLYDKQGFALPVQRSREGKPTADADAIERLLTLAATQQVAGAVETIRSIKLYQHHEKIKSTFANPTLDGEGYAHPEYRVWGAGTGRPASGADDDVTTDRGGASQYNFNAFNVPDEVRKMYVPDPMVEASCETVEASRETA